MRLSKFIPLFSAIAMAAAPAFSQNATPSGSQWRGTSASAPAKLECGQFSVPSRATVTSYQIQGTGGLWIANAGGAVVGAFPNAANVVGYSFGPGTFYICPDMPYQGVNKSWASISISW